MNLDRSAAPTFYPIQGFRAITPEKKEFSNGLKAFVFHGGDQDLVRIEWIFPNLMGAQEDTLLHSCLSPMLLEGTNQKTNAEIADLVDFHGAYLVPEFHTDYTSLTLFSLTRHLPNLLPVIYELLTEASFPEKEWKTYIRNRKQRLEIALRKNDVLSRRTFNRQLFGQSRYGISPDPDDYDALELSDLKNIFKRQIQPANCQIFIAGKLSAETHALMEQYFAQNWTNHSELALDAVPTFPVNKGDTLLTTILDSLQSAIRLGYRSIQRGHPDFPGLQFVNTLLGGYFGSRLMMNIREDKGYTYGIGSGIAVMKHASFFTISTEVGVESTASTLEEIEKEIARLQVEPVSEDEMELVRNYILGSLLGSLENIFSHADKFKQTYFSGIELDYFDYYQEEILAMNTTKVKELAIRYLDYAKMEKIITGAMP